MRNISVVLLAAGMGKRMGMETPKQFLPLHCKPIACHSLEVFLSHPMISEVIVVCDFQFHTIFSSYPVRFANGGERRQDSLYNGFKECDSDSDWICVHDAARPFISKEMLDFLFEEGKKTGAATVGVPIKSTIKETCRAQHVIKTLDRTCIWEIQTPQFLNRKILEQGFEHANRHGLTVTDDVSLAECIGHSVKVVLGSYDNLKITTPEDLVIAQCINTKFT